MVNIKLDSHWSLTSDSRQWILNLDERAQTFHSTLDNAITSYFGRKIRGSDSRSISGLLEYHKHILTTLNQVLTPFKIKVVGEES